MSNIPPKWINFAKKYLSLPEDLKSAWLQKLAPGQQEYLKFVLQELAKPATKNTVPTKPAQNFDLKPRLATKNTTIDSRSISKINLNPLATQTQSQNYNPDSNPNIEPSPKYNPDSNPNIAPKLKQNPSSASSSTKIPDIKSSSAPSLTLPSQAAESQSFLVEFPSSQLQTSGYPQFSSTADQNKPKTLNMSLIMPAQKFDLGIASKSKKTLNQTKQFSNSANLSKKEYLKQKAGMVIKNTIVQAILIALVLAVPIAGTAFALNNPSSVKTIGSGQKSIAQVLAEQSSGQNGVADLDFKAWIADYDLKDQDKAANSDPDQDGLTNIAEFSFKTIPTNSQTCNNSKLDGQNILAQIDPVTCKPINFNDPNIAAKFDGVISRSQINYRLSMVALNRFLNLETATAPDSLVKSSETATTDLNIDYSQKATLEIKAVDSVFKADQKYEITWVQSTDATQLLDRVDQQIVAYPTKVIPGEIGNLYLSGKAQIKSNSPEILSDGVDIFTKLDHLEPGDNLILSLKTKAGQSKSFRYKVQSQNLFLASDPKQFKTSKVGNSELTLATPWTASSPDQRLLVRAILDKIE